MENKINYAAMTLDDIIFINRNKAYGAYELRRSYNENVKRAILGTIFFTAFALGYQNIFARLHLMNAQKQIETVIDLAKVDNIEITTPPPPQKPQIEKPKGVMDAATVALGEKKPVSDEQAKSDSLMPIDPEVAISDHTQAGTKGETPGLENGSAPIEIHVAQPVKESAPLSWAEVMPEFPGGEKALLNFIRKNLSYPSYENEMGIQGKAVVGFVIDENGKVSDVKILRSVSKGIDRESMRVIKMLPDFSPGMQSGRKVKVRYVIPLDFHQTAD